MTRESTGRFELRTGSAVGARANLAGKGCRSGDHPGNLTPGGAPGLTQVQLAERMRTIQSVIARLEAGERVPSLVTLERVATALGGWCLSRADLTQTPARSTRMSVA